MFQVNMISSRAHTNPIQDGEQMDWTKMALGKFSQSHGYLRCTVFGRFITWQSSILLRPPFSNYPNDLPIGPSKGVLGEPCADSD